MTLNAKERLIAIKQHVEEYELAVDKGLAYCPDKKTFAEVKHGRCGSTICSACNLDSDWYVHDDCLEDNLVQSIKKELKEIT